MADKNKTRDVAHDFSALSLTPDNFHAFYTKFINLRFPMQVAHVLELRYLINHAADKYKEPALTSDYRQFLDSLEGALTSFSVDNPRHRERLLRILSMLRDVHYTHSVDSRNAEEQLRQAMAENRAERDRSVRYGLFFILAGITFCLFWVGMENPHWAIKWLPVAYGCFAWRYFHKLPGLDANMGRLTADLNEVLRRRVRSLNWKTLIHKLALVLGYKRVPGIEVFHVDSDTEHHGNSRVYH